jgi:hypothetical protein
MSLKTSARKYARELKDLGFPFLLRVKLSKLIVCGFTGPEALEKLGAVLISSWGCECCGAFRRRYRFGSYSVGTEYGRLTFCSRNVGS